MMHQQQKLGTISRLKSGVKTVVTKLRTLPIKQSHTARSKPEINENNVPLRVLDPTPPPSPPPGALIAAENWPEFSIVHRHSPQRTRHPVVDLGRATARCTQANGGVELACITENDDDETTVRSDGSDFDATSTESYSTEATSTNSLAETRLETAPIPHEDADYRKARSPMPDEEC
ncbi:hypothetical protein VMCG_10163 [Cytospora schulzeri]|uniref:Uncharacterized protein n=1 Tax=Cytospora schulzeri TaxID=448051 RepID=A0A423VDH2_9PEZI|nr:hypothetical protein VMCG_10163 [Valsa malicola]